MNGMVALAKSRGNCALRPGDSFACPLSEGRARSSRPRSFAFVRYPIVPLDREELTMTRVFSDLASIRLLAVLLVVGSMNAVVRVPCAEAQAPAGGYTVTDLGTLGGFQSEAYALNDWGEVTGWSYTAAFQGHAFLFSNGTMTDLGLGTVSGSVSVGRGINNLGEVTGYANAGSGSHAFLYSGGVRTDLGTFGGFFSSGTAINDAGQIAGYAENAAGHDRAFLYSNGTMTDLGTLGGVWSIGYGINSAGQVTGPSDTGTGFNVFHAFVYSNGAMIDLGTLGGSISSGYGINDAGQVTGYSGTGTGQSHAFVYSGGAMVDIGTLGGPHSFGLAINNSGEVTGSAYTAGFDDHAFLYSGGTMYDLNDLVPTDSGWVLLRGTGINNNGQITGYGFINGQLRAFLLTPITNTPPFAAASIVLGGEEVGQSAEVECDGPSGATVTLNGTGSSDPDGDALEYEWSVAEDSGASIAHPGEAVTEATFPVGVHQVTLTVSDLKGGMDVATVSITVVDDTPPLVRITTDRAALLPPNNKMVPVGICVEASDACTDPLSLAVLCTVASSQPDDSDGTGELVGDVNGADGFLNAVPVTLEYLGDGLYGALIHLRAERDGADPAGRVYSVNLEVMDAAGHTGQASTTVVVPHDRRRN
jgi:probable HAF family extracellular repeat protein